MNHEPRLDRIRPSSDMFTLVTERLWTRSWVPQTRVRRLIFAGAILYASVQMSRGLYLAISADTNDITAIRDLFWSILGGDPMPSPYPPHTFVLLAPILLLPLPLTEVTMFILNLSLIFFIWRRVGSALTLIPEERAWFLAFFLCWVSVRVTLSHGQLGLLALAGAVLAFTSPALAWLGFVVSSAKYSLSFPVLFDQLLRKPRTLVPTILLGVAGTGLFLVWTGMPISDYASYLGEGLSREVTGLGVDVVSALAQSFGTSAWMQMVVGALWLVLFFVVRRRIRHTVVLLAILLSLSLLPVYHRFYDLVVLAPALGILLKSRPLVYPLVMTMGLAGVDVALGKRDFFGVQWIETVARWYTPVLVSIVIAILIRIDSSDRALSGAADRAGGRT